MTKYPNNNVTEYYSLKSEKNNLERPSTDGMSQTKKAP